MQALLAHLTQHPDDIKLLSTKYHAPYARLCAEVAAGKAVETVLTMGACEGDCVVCRGLCVDRVDRVRRLCCVSTASTASTVSAALGSAFKKQKEHCPSNSPVSNRPRAHQTARLNHERDKRVLHVPQRTHVCRCARGALLRHHLPNGRALCGMPVPLALYPATRAPASRSLLFFIPEFHILPSSLPHSPLSIAPSACGTLLRRHEDEMAAG